ncbi:uncharacterized protein LOC100583821 [Nomascus leucogenys]|uniref:uncharacterized protein LOC100583821 n=1 Tax=Nomascus leucogenys TaxID=61853 RepID=UPI0002ADBA29|nr:uncharacterized protein LOC100583821 [Nomascus leucogenys]
MARSTIISISEMWTGPQQRQGVSWLLNSRIRSRLEDEPLCLGRTSPAARGRAGCTALLDPGTGSGSGSASAKGPARRPGAEEARRSVASALRLTEVGAQLDREARPGRGCQAHSNRGRPVRMGSRARRAQSPWGGEQECSCEPRRALPPAQPSAAGPLLSHRRTESSLPASAEPWPRNCLKARPLHLPTSVPASSPAAKIAGLYNDLEPPRKTMRRGVLMTLLQQSAMTLPLWIGKPGDKPPPLCGAIPASGDYVARPGDKPQDDYSILFEDTSYADGYSPHLSVAQRYLVASKEPKKK